MTTTDIGMPASGLHSVPHLPDDAGKQTKRDFTSDQEVRWCPGCGDYVILAAVQSFLPELGLKRENIVFVSGIGCSSRFPYYLDTYGMHSIHGRAPAIATGLATSRADLSVWVVTGDGDALSIGGNHLIHALRRNVNMTILLFNNQIYGLTKGQYSPTSKVGQVTKSTPVGSVDNPFNPVSLALGAEATFVARAMESDRAELTGILRAAAEHRGTALVEIYQNCPIFNDGAFEVLKDRSQQEARIVRLRSGEPVTVGAEGERKVLVRTSGGGQEFVARGGCRGPRRRRPRRRRRRPERGLRPLAPGHPGDEPRPDGHLPPGLAPHLRRPRPRPGRGGGRRRRRSGDRRRPHRPAARTRHLDRRVTSTRPPVRAAVGGDDAGDDGELRRGTVYGFLAYGIWGLFPLYFAALEPSGAWEILGHRILWTLAVCALVLLVRRDLAWIRPFVARKRLVGGITVAALLIAANWVIYVLAVITDRTYEAALGYFLNPIVTVALGVVVLKERLRPLQWAAVAVGALASVYLAVAGGVLPWISLSLAFSFGLYGLVKKKVGASLDAMHSLAAETAVLAPVALVIVAVLVRAGRDDLPRLRHRAHDAARAVGARHRGAAAALRGGRAAHPPRHRRADPVRHARSSSSSSASSCSAST